MARLVFMGTPAFSVPILEMLIESKHEIVLVVTKADKIVGRKRELAYSKIKEVALKHNLPLFQPEKLRKDYQKIIDVKPDLVITAAYGQILPKDLLDNIKAINVHGSLLPEYRGGAPIQYALFDGKKETGITIMEMAYGMDSGDMIIQGSLKIEDNDNYTSLTEKLSFLGRDLLIEHLDDIIANNYTPIHQDESKVTFAYNIKRTDEFLDFSESAQNVINKIRGLSLEPGASFIHKNIAFKTFSAKKSDIIEVTQPGEIVETKKRLVISCLDANIEIETILQEGKKKMNIKDFLNGQNIFKKGDILERTSYE